MGKDNKHQMMEYNFITKYSHKKEDGKKESWEESIKRIWDTHRKKYEKELTYNGELQQLFDFSEELEKQKYYLSAQRLRQFAIPDYSKGIFKHNFKAYNCSATYMDRKEAFGEAMYVLLCGSGAGISVQKHHVNKLPVVKGTVDIKRSYTIEDSIEGWGDAINNLVNSYFAGEEEINFDYSQIRAKGSLIANQFIAPGPEGLKTSINKIKEIFEGARGRKLKPIETYDIIMWIAEAVLSGGVRRSAVIIQFSVDDDEMMNAKTGDWYVKNKHRSLSNNSAALVRGKVTKEQFSKLMAATRDFGEPGFLFLEHEDVVYNPCAEIAMMPKTEDGRSGWSVCNLTEINGGKLKNEHDFYEAAKAASIAGTLQAGYTDFKFLSPATKEIIERDALIGVSITGWMDNPDLLFNVERLNKAAQIVIDYNHKVADLIGINYAKRTTTVKPSGNASILLGTTSGIHGEHSPRYIRNITANEDEIGQAIYNYVNPFAVERKVGSNTDNMISFAIKSKPNSLFKDQLYGVKQLEYVAFAQKHWINPGTYEDSTFGVKMRHNVSNTITVAPNQWEEVEEFLWENRDSFSGVSLLGSYGDLDYAQAPYQKVKTPQELTEEYGSAAILASGLIVEGSDVFDHLWEGCNAAKFKYNLKPKVDDDLATKIKLNKQFDWVRRLKKFAKNYTNNDLDKAIYCLKDVYLLHRWNKLKNETHDINWGEVDFSQEILKANELEAACAGGNCEVK